MTAPLRREVCLKARPKARFALATKNTPRRVLHLVDQAEAVWSRRWPRKTLGFERFAAKGKCNRWLQNAALHLTPPDGFELCNYCLAAELGIEVTSTAAKVLARASADVLDQAERQVGMPVSRAVRLARLEVVA